MRDFEKEWKQAERRANIKALLMLCPGVVGLIVLIIWAVTRRL